MSPARSEHSAPLTSWQFVSPSVSELKPKLNGELKRFAQRALEVKFPYLILNARYGKVCEDDVIRSWAVREAIGIDWEGRRQILAVNRRTRKHHELGASCC